MKQKQEDNNMRQEKEFNSETKYNFYVKPEQLQKVAQQIRAPLSTKN